MFQPTHPKKRAEKSLDAIERELYDAHDMLERAQHNIAFLEARRDRLSRYVANYDAVEMARIEYPSIVGMTSDGS